MSGAQKNQHKSYVALQHHKPIPLGSTSLTLIHQRLFNSPTFSDLTLCYKPSKGDLVTYNAHRAVLCSQSGYFRKKLVAGDTSNGK